MSETTASQPHNSQKTAAAQNPFTAPFTAPFQAAGFNVPSFAEATDGWKKLMDEQLGRMQSAMEQFTGLEQKGFEQANQAVEEMAKLTKATLQYAHDLTGAFRTMALENGRKMAGLETPARKA